MRTCRFLPRKGLFVGSPRLPAGLPGVEEKGFEPHRGSMFGAFRVARGEEHGTPPGFMPLFAPTPGGGYAATGGYQQITPTG